MRASRTQRRKTLLVHFVSDLLRNERLQRRAAEDPDRLERSYGLTRQQVRVLRSRNKRRITTAMLRELETACARVVRKYPEV